MKQKKVAISVDMGGGKSSCVILENLSPTLTCTHYGEPVVCYEAADSVGVKSESRNDNG